jgi:hypothetical protein
MLICGVLCRDVFGLSREVSVKTSESTVVFTAAVVMFWYW